MKWKNKQKPGGVSKKWIQKNNVYVCLKKKKQEEPNIWIQDKLTLFLS